jgi:very-short-patch-repair endonuclease
MWGALRGSQLGVGFRSQFIIGARFIVDFAAPGVRLVVEIDGGYHQRRQRADARRDRDLRRLGWRVLRLPAALVLHQLDAAVALVRAAIVAR